MYNEFLATDKEVNMMLDGEKLSPLVALSYLKMLCGHPILAMKQDRADSNYIRACSRDSLLVQSKKLQALVALVDKLKNLGSRTLIFSQSTRMLDIISRVLSHIKILRIDGSTKERDRQLFVDEFNDETSTVFCMLLSTKAGGLGLTLTGANQAIIYDPSWNPAEDSQAIDRCYRIGAKKAVTVYRLIAAGTVEERMYEKQVFKDGIKRAVIQNAGTEVHRYFTKADLMRLFTLSPPGQCEMLDRALGLENAALKPDDYSSFVESLPSIVGVSLHDALYSESSTGSELKEIPLEKNGRENMAEDFIPLGRSTMLNKTRQNRLEAKSRLYAKANSAEEIIFIDM